MGKLDDGNTKPLCLLGGKMKKDKTRFKAHIQYRNKENKPIPGVTTATGILDKGFGIIHSAWKLGREDIDYRKEWDEAKIVGTATHDIIYCINTNQPFDSTIYSPAVMKQVEIAFKAYNKWEAEHPNFESILLEKPLVSEYYQYGGTLDAFGVEEDKHILIDYKTSKAIFDNNIYQLSAYSHLLWENGYMKFNVSDDFNSYVLRLDKKTGDFEYKLITKRERNIGFQIFRRCLETYNLKKELKNK